MQQTGNQPSYQQPDQPQYPPHYAVPGAQGPYPPRKSGLPVWAILLIVGGVLLFVIPAGCLLFIGVAAGRSDSRTPTDGGATASDETASTERAAYLVSAEALHAEYAANEIAADEKYKGKLIVVFGSLAEIRKDAFDNAVLDLATGKSQLSLYEVHCKLRESEQGQAASLGKGTVVFVKGRCDGFLLKSVMLSDCAILKTISQRQYRSMTREQLADELRAVPEIRDLAGDELPGGK